jgi:hypothetical protein
MFNKIVLVILKLGILFFATNAHSVDDTWLLKIDDRENDVVLHYRKTADGLTEFRGVTHIKSSLSGFVALFRDVDAMPRWVDHAHKATKLKQVSDYEVYAHIVTRMPFPFTYRHSIVHTFISQDPLTREIVINGRDAEEGYLLKLSPEKQVFLAEQNKYVLIRNLKSHWAFRPQADGMVEVEFQGYGDPGGSISKFIPQGLLRMFVWEAPYNTLKGMRKIVGKAEYQTRRFSFISEFSPL